MNKDAYNLEEYKHISSAILEIDKRILQVFAVTIAVAVSLLSAVAGLVLGKQHGPVTVVLAYTALAPGVLVIAAFYLMLSQRLDMMRLGSYRRILFEERNQIEGWETQLEKFRKLEKIEANDPIPYTYWAVLLASGILFTYGIVEAEGSLYHSFMLVPLLLLLGRAHYRWMRVVPTELSRYFDLWRKVIASKETS